MPHSLRHSLLLAGLSLLLLPSPHVLADPLPPTKSPRPLAVSLPSDPALLSPLQRLKLALAPVPALPDAAVSPRPRLGSARGESTVAPVEISAADRAILDARLKAKLEAHRVPPVRVRTMRFPAQEKPVVPQSTILVGPPGPTPAERAKAEAAGLLAPAAKEVRP